MKLKRWIAAALSLCMLGGAVTWNVPAFLDTGITVNAAEIVKSGTCGENLTWTLDAEGTLIISGTGEMDYFKKFEGNTDIKNVIIEDGVTNIGRQEFYGCTSLVSVDIPKTVNIIDYTSF